MPRKTEKTGSFLAMGQHFNVGFKMTSFRKRRIVSEGGQGGDIITTSAKNRTLTNHVSEKKDEGGGYAAGLQSRLHPPRVRDSSSSKRGGNGGRLDLIWGGREKDRRGL